MVDNSKPLGIILWFTGLSGSGKTTLAEAVKASLKKINISVCILDGDIVRATNHQNLGFSESDIKSNNSLIVDMCVLERKKYDVVMVPIISPYRQSRNEALMELSPGFYEIYFSASLECVRRRDVKGLYDKADNGLINNMIGVSPNNEYQIPITPDFIINSEKDKLSISVGDLFRFIVFQLKKLSKFEHL